MACKGTLEGFNYNGLHTIEYVIVQVASHQDYFGSRQDARGVSLDET